MYILVVKTGAQITHRYVAATKKPLMERLDTLRGIDDIIAWRLHRNGWIAGSPDAWREINAPYFGLAEILI